MSACRCFSALAGPGQGLARDLICGLVPAPRHDGRPRLLRLDERRQHAGGHQLLGKSGRGGQPETDLAGTGSPNYGKPEVHARYLTRSGQPESGNVPHIDVTFKGTEIFVTSTKTISSAKTGVFGRFDRDDQRQAKTGTFKGSSVSQLPASGSNRLRTAGSGEFFDLDDTAIKSALRPGNVSCTLPELGRVHLLRECQRQPGLRRRLSLEVRLHDVDQLRAGVPRVVRRDSGPVENDHVSVVGPKSGVDVFVDYRKANAIEDRVRLAIDSTSTGRQRTLARRRMSRSSRRSPSSASPAITTRIPTSTPA